MELGNLFFKFSGRINRSRYWLAWLVYIAIYLVLAAIGSMTDSATLAALSSMITVVIFISGLAVGIKRLHDRNKNGWLVVVLYVVPAVLFLAAMIIGASRGGAGAVANGLWLTALALALWSGVELGCLRGTIGGNTYGPDPIAPETLSPPVHTH